MESRCKVKIDGATVNGRIKSLLSIGARETFVSCLMIRETVRTRSCHSFRRSTVQTSNPMSSRVFCDSKVYGTPISLASGKLLNRRFSFGRKHVDNPSVEASDATNIHNRFKNLIRR